jgi:hypothetical protein
MICPCASRLRHKVLRCDIHLGLGHRISWGSQDLPGQIKKPLPKMRHLNSLKNDLPVQIMMRHEFSLSPVRCDNEK